jgi:hypothetical protein
MQRVGYDADTQKYSFRDASGSFFESAPGARYGKLVRVGEDPESPSSSTEDSPTDGKPVYTFEEMQLRNQDVDLGNRDSVRKIIPFALLVLVYMFLLFRLVYGGFGWTTADGGNEQVLDCGQGSRQVQIARGDTCWGIAEGGGVGVEELLGLQGNEGVDCDRLRVGQAMCVPA